jgi:uncharacterized protein (DUF302 family)
MFDHTIPYGFGAIVDLPYAEAVARTKAALADEGFGVLAEIDVSAALRRKLGVDFRQYVILGACNPPFGLLLPCNVVVYSTDEPGRSVVAALDPAAALSLTDNPALETLAAETGDRLRCALEAAIAPHELSPQVRRPQQAAADVPEEIC